MSGKVEWNYAPMTGDLLKKVDGVAVRCPDWATFHELKSDFLEKRKQGLITLKKGISFGHELFHGHQGRVDIYE